MIVSCALLAVFWVLTSSVRAEFLIVSTFSDEVLLATDNGGYRGAYVAAGAGGINAPRTAAWGPDWNLYVGDWPGLINVYDGRSGEFIRTVINKPGAGWHGLEFAPDGALLASALAENKVYRLNPQNGQVLSAVDGIPQPGHLLHALDGTVLVGSGKLGTDSAIYKVNPVTGENLGVFATGAGLNGPHGLDYGFDGNLYTCNLYGDYGIYRIDPITGAVLGKFAQPEGMVGTSDLLFVSGNGLWAVSLNNSVMCRMNALTGEVEREAMMGAGLLDLLYVPHDQLVFPEPSALAIALPAIVASLRRRR